MFERPPETYKLSKKTVNAVMNDKAGPLYQIVSLVPEGSKILDVGAGNGLLSLCFKKIAKNITIDGVEPSKEAHQLAKSHYRKMYNGYLQDFWTVIKQEKYDYIVLADVIEHVVDPEEFLKNIFSKIGKSTKVILSTPNVAFASVRLALLNGRFDYVDSGLLERTHLRFFTVDTLKSLVINCNVGTEKVIHLQRKFDHTEIPTPLSKDKIELIRMTKDDYASVYQFLLVLTKEHSKVGFDKYSRVGESTKIWEILKSR